MVDNDEKETLLRSLKGYLEELRESGVDELPYGERPGERAAPPGPGCRGVGNPAAPLLLVLAGSGFAGAAGELLAKIVQAMGFATSEVFLLSFTPGSSVAGTTLRAELMRRIAEVGPQAVVTLGEEAAQLLLDSREPVEKLRGRFHRLQGMQLMPTLHPEALLENEALKREVWSDMKQVMRLLETP